MLELKAALNGFIPPSLIVAPHYFSGGGPGAQGRPLEGDVP